MPIKCPVRVILTPTQAEDLADMAKAGAERGASEPGRIALAKLRNALARRRARDRRAARPVLLALSEGRAHG